MNLSNNIQFGKISKDELIILVKVLIVQNRKQGEQIVELTKKLELLTTEVIALRKELHRLKHPKNSSNSSVPPSKDENRPKRNRSLRRKSGKKSGGQKGHKGITLKLVDNPTTIEELVPAYCNKCGKDLQDKEAVLHSVRQTVDIPPIIPIYTEYQCYGKHCDCGHYQLGTYPKNVTNHIQYGNNVESLIGYLSVYQYVPYKRMADMFSRVFNLPISQGTIKNKLEKLANKAKPLYKQIHDFIEVSKSVKSDETGVRVNGDKQWAWVWQNPIVTYLLISSNRAKRTIEKAFPNGFVNAILHSDRWSPQLTTVSKGHQLCMSHLLRDINYLIELEKSAWAKNIKAVFKDALELKRKKPKYVFGDPLTNDIETRLDKLLSEDLEKEDYPKSLTFLKQMKKHRNSLFPFLYNEGVEPDNNSSERSIRNFKVKQKISGQFKTGQQTFAILRSLVDTFIKNDLSVLESLQVIASLPAEVAE